MNGIKDLDISKASQENDTLTNILKETADIPFGFIYQSFNNMIDIYIFPT